MDNAQIDRPHPNTTANRIPQLDGLRGLAILLVLIWHYFVITPSAGDGPTVMTLKRLFFLSWSGVDLFFVLSGFLIGGILIEYRRGPNYFRAFYSRRFFRIVPLYALLLICYFSTSAQVDWKGSEPLTQLLASDWSMWTYPLFLQNFSMAFHNSFGPEWVGITWSLAIEEQFYLFLPLFIFFVSPKRLPLWCLFFILFGTAFRLVTITSFENRGALASFVLLPARMDQLFMGVLGAWMMRQERIVSIIKHNRWFLILCIALFGGILTYLAWSKTTSISTTMSLLGYSWLGLLYLSLVLLALCSPGRTVLGVLTFRPLRALGYISYFVYLFHQLFLYVMHLGISGTIPQHETPGGVLATISALFLVLVAGAVSYFKFELPLIKYGRRIKYSRCQSGVSG